MEILDVFEAAEYVKCSVRKMYELTRRCEIPHKKLGGKYRYKKEDLEKWFDSLPQN